MKNRISKWVLNLAGLLLLSSGLLAQEKAEVTIRIMNDGKVIKDTTYQFEDASEAENALEMMEILSGDEPHPDNFQYNYTMSQVEGDQTRTMVFISKDGGHTEITELQGDSLIWIAEDDEGLEDVMKKKIRVTVSDDSGGTWTVSEEGDTISEDGENVYIIRGHEDDVKVKVQTIMEEKEDGKETKVIVIKKDVDGDRGIDLDEDHDMDQDVDVKVIKKKKIEEDTL